MLDDLVVKKPSGLIVPDDAVFEQAPILPHDAAVRPTSGDAIHLDGSSSKGEVVEYLHFDNDGRFVHEMKQDVEPALEWAKQQRNMYGNRAGKSQSGEWYHAARVPQVVIIAWLNARGLTMSDFKGEIVDRFLNDTENSAFRIWQGRV